MEKIKLGDLCKPSVGQIKEDEDTLIDYIDISSVDNETKKITGYQTIIFGESPSRARKAVKRGDVLVSTVRPNLNSVALLEEDTPNVTVASTGFCVLESKDDVDPRFVFNFCKSKPFIDEMVSQATGASYPAVSDKIVRSALVPKYSYQEQQSISAVLDKLTGIIDSRRSELQELDNLIKARFVELFGNLNTNPKGWDLKTFDELTYLITDGEHATPRRSDKGIYLLSARNVLNHALQLEDVDYIDEDEYERIAKRIVPQAGDVLLSCSGTVGRCCCVPEGLKFQMVRSTAILRFKEELNPVFAEYMITSDYVQKQIDKAKTASSQANLFQGKIAKLKGFVPPIELQDEFLGFVNQVDKSKVAVQKALDGTQTLFDSLMQEYFG